MLPEESRGFGVSGVGYTGKHVMVDIIHVEHLFNAMSELMHGDVVAFIIHTGSRDTGAKSCILFASEARPCVTGTACGFNYDMTGDSACIFGVETHLLKQSRHVGCKGIGVRIESAGLC